MDEIRYNRKILLAIRLILFAIGFTFGFLTIYQILDVYGGFVKNLALKIMFFAASSLLPALALTFSAKGFYKMLESLSQRVAKSATSVKVQELAAVIFAVILGTLLGYLCDIVLSFVLNILALRLVLDIAVGMIGIYFVLIFSLKWLRIAEKNVEEQEQKEQESLSTNELKGYLLTLSALKNERAFHLFSKVLVGEKFVLKGLEGSKELLEDSTALYNYESLKTGGFVSVLKEDILEGEAEKLNQVLLKHSLKLAVSTRVDAAMLLEGKEDGVLIIEEL